MFSQAEIDRRFKAADKMMKDEGLSGLLILGNGAVGTNSYGNFRYLVDNRTFYYIQIAIFAPDKKPISLASTIVSQLEFKNKSFVKDCRIAPNSVDGIINTFKELGIKSGKVGTALDLMPSAWYIPLTKALPDIEFVDISEPLFKIRNVHSAEEVEVFKQCAKLADIGYDAVCKNIRPGMTEQQAIAELEYAIQRNGGEYNFSLISSGRFSFKDNQLPCIHAATMFDKVIEPGDSVAMEITPRYNGYWTQLVRTISIGEPSKDFVEIHKVAVDTINEAISELKPGNPIGNIPKKVRKLTEKAGYVFSLPCGHICGSDLNEERLEEGNTRQLIPGMAVILHPSIVAPGHKTSIFWGETFMITETGCEKLMKSSDDLVII